MKYYVNDEETKRENLLKYIPECDILDLEAKISHKKPVAMYDYGDFIIKVEE